MTDERRRLDDYVDLEDQERQKFLAVDGIGPKTAETLLHRYDLFERAVDQFLTAPNAYPAELGATRTDQIRDALQEGGYEPSCACSHYDEVRNSQARDDVLSHCRTCGEVISR